MPSRYGFKTPAEKEAELRQINRGQTEEVRTKVRDILTDFAQALGDTAPQEEATGHGYRLWTGMVNVHITGGEEQPPSMVVETHNLDQGSDQDVRRVLRDVTRVPVTRAPRRLP